MFTKFEETIFGSMAQEWNARLLLPALIFWEVGLLAWISSQGWNYDSLVDLFNKFDTKLGLAFSAIILILIVASGSLIEWFQLPILRLVEGYWPSYFNTLKSFLIKRKKEELKVKQSKWDTLAKKYNMLSETQLEEYNRLEAELAPYPKNIARLLPTRLGNLLSAAEEYPYNRYGLEAIIVWPRFWLVLLFIAISYVLL